MDTNLITLFGLVLFSLLVGFLWGWKMSRWLPNKTMKIRLLQKYSDGYQQGRFDEAMEVLRKKDNLP